ncbi:hypothetical protein KOM00_00565 [Geomonas sp. Red69]|uniref:hypothetical protein n=1 Tax=Geomonas diazotrophica TaxID=2843197 RepID=UPI001C0F61BB|nr:hypothetical protein [Geomonas diazotrophica]MBU5635221.1 hypothetical protein [Geomonas diazotrophica]
MSEALFDHGHLFADKVVPSNNLYPIPTRKTTTYLMQIRRNSSMSVCPCVHFSIPSCFNLVMPSARAEVAGRMDLVDLLHGPLAVFELFLEQVAFCHLVPSSVTLSPGFYSGTELLLKFQNLFPKRYKVGTAALTRMGCIVAAVLVLFSRFGVWINLASPWANVACNVRLDNGLELHGGGHLRHRTRRLCHHPDHHKQWGTTAGNWSGALDFSGNRGVVNGTGNVQLNGAAAGRINSNGAGTFSGTAAGRVR